jgi:hypothetical protein
MDMIIDSLFNARRNVKCYIANYKHELLFYREITRSFLTTPCKWLWNDSHTHSFFENWLILKFGKTFSVLALKYEYEVNCQEKSRFYKFISKRRTISLMHNSILRSIWLNFMAICLVFIGSFKLFTFFFPLDFQLFRPEHHWRDLSSRNAHLVHQNWYRISFTF